MARLYADEQFPAGATRRLRLLGHDVLTVQQTNVSKYGDGKLDTEVLRIAMLERRAVLTLNYKHFLQLGKDVHWHSGIIVCVRRYRSHDRLARAIHSAIKNAIRSNTHLTGQVIRVY